MKNKLFIASLAAAVAIPALVAPIQADAVVKTPFKDVTPKSPYYDIIHTMRDKGIVGGYEDGTFRPNESISRKHAAALVSRAKNLPAVKPFVKFKDVSESNPYFKDVKKLQQAGIFVADAKGNLNPNQPITRAEMAKILAISFDLKGKSVKDFPDVSKKHTAYEYVSAIYAHGVTTGDEGLFKPDAPLTRAHYAVFMYRASGKSLSDNKPGNENDNNSSIDIGSLTDEQIAKLTDDQVAELLVTYRFEKAQDLELPKGNTNKDELSSKLAKQYKTYFNEHSIDRNNSRPMTSKTLLAAQMRNFANLIQKPYPEFIEMVNQAYLTGELITNDADDPVIFAMHFNYTRGHLVFGWRSF